MKKTHASVLSAYFAGFLFFNLILCRGYAQEGEDINGNKPHKTPDELLSQVSFGSALGTDAYSVPKVALKTYKFSALIGKGEWDFYLFNSVPAISIHSADSEQYLRNDLVRQLGGIFNVALAKNGYFGNGNDPDLRDVKGARYEFRAGAKAVDVLGGESDERNLVAVLQSTMDFMYMIPLVKHRKKDEMPAQDSNELVGNLSFRVLGAVLYVPNSNVFDEYYSTRRGIPPDPTIFAGTLELFFYITNQFYINAGYSFTSEDQIKPIPYFSISYGKRDD